MDYDFFQEQKQEDEAERTPATPQLKKHPIQKRKERGKWKKILLMRLVLIWNS